MSKKELYLVLTNPKGLDKSIEFTPKLKRKIIRETMKEIQELYYDIKEPQEDYDWQCDKGMIKRAITSSIENLIKELNNS